MSSFLNGHTDKSSCLISYVIILFLYHMEPYGSNGWVDHVVQLVAVNHTDSRLLHWCKANGQSCPTRTQCVPLFTQSPNVWCILDLSKCCPCVQTLPVSWLECLLEACMQITPNVGSAEPCELRITQRHCAPRMCSQQHHRRPKLDDVPSVGGANPTYHLAKCEEKKIHLLRRPEQPNLPAQLKAHRLSKSKEITIIMTASLCHYRTTYQRL